MTVFDTVAGDYDAFRPPYPDALFDHIEMFAGPVAGRRVLDLAAGTGIASRALIERGAGVVAADLGADMLRVLRARSGDTAPVVVARAESLPFADSSFDVVACATAWHWIDEEAGPVEARRVLRDSGTLALWWGLGGHDTDPECARREQDVYARWRVGEREPLTQPPSALDPVVVLPARGFVDVVAHEITDTRIVSVREHVGHVSTHSPVMALRDDLGAFQADLVAVHAGHETVTENVYCRLVLARRA